MNYDRLSMSDTSPQTTSQHLMYPTTSSNNSNSGGNNVEIVLVNSPSANVLSTTSTTNNPDPMHLGRNISRVSTTQLNQTNSSGGAVVMNKIPLSHSGSAINRRSTGDELNSNYQYQNYAATAGITGPQLSNQSGPATVTTTSGHMNLGARNSDQSQYATYQNVAFKQKVPVISTQEQMIADDLAAKQLIAARKGKQILIYIKYT